MMLELERGVSVAIAPDALSTIATVNLRGVQLAALTEAQCARLILNELDAGRGGWLLTMNLDHLRRFEQDPAFAALVQDATLCIADGMPLIWASHLQGTPLPERVTGSNLIWSLSNAAAERRRSIFLLGGTSYAIMQTAQILQQRFPRLKLVGVLTPELGFEQDAAQLEQLKHALVAAQPDIVYVALGSPKADELIDSMQTRLPHTWWLGVGVSFSFVSGEIPRAPLWVQRMGFEWLHRLIQEPQHLYKRYLLQGIPFALVLLSDALYKRITTRTRV